LVIKAVAIALEELKPRYPELNSFLRNWLGWKSIVEIPGISAGCSTALDTEDCVVVGVIEEPQKKGLPAIAEEMRQFSNEASPFVKDSRVFHRLPRPIQWIAHTLSVNLARVRYERRGSFCLNPVGKFGVDLHLSLPQTSSLQFGMGEVRERVVARDGSPFVVNSFFLTLSFDRRLMNGRPPATLLGRARTILNQAEFNDRNMK
jgi:pyruvate/2-oxoglutarate dehydrogenase complex dihydrolipoamide acyltransferase (E2) component